MDFAFSEEQTLLRNSVQKYVQNSYSFDARRAVVKSEAGWKRDNWNQFAELGLLAAPCAGEHGGLGGGPIETMIIMEEFGRGLVVEPYLGTVVLGGGFLRHGGSKAQKDHFIPEIIEGKRVLAFAFAEPQGRYNLADLQVSAKKSGA